MNNSKQTVLSIVGIAILVIAVVGVSFAFFTYSRTGQENNIITTGTIVFDSNIAGDNAAAALTLQNKFPQTDADGKTNKNAGTGGTAYTFNVHGTIPTTANDVYYGVFVEETTPSGYNTNNRFQPSEVSVYATVTRSPDTGSDSATVTARYSTGNYRLTNNVKKTNQSSPYGELIAYGMIDNTGVAQQHNYTLTMWINDTVTISDTDYSKTYRAHAYNAETWPEMPGVNASGLTPSDSGYDDTKLPYSADPADDRKVFSNMWYSIKVNVQASDPTVAANQTVYSAMATAANA